MPKDIQLRSELIALDGIGCGLVGAHLPWSEKAVKALFGLEPAGSCLLLGWENESSASAAALFNSTFIRAFELYDWHINASLHNASLLIPALLASAEHSYVTDGSTITGESFLLAFIKGLEVGPRIGLGLGGAEILSLGWHSGVILLLLLPFPSSCCSLLHRWNGHLVRGKHGKEVSKPFRIEACS